jgi:hypothetical protein
MNLQAAKALRKGDYVHHVTKKNADGTPMRAKVTSVKTWKTRPEKVEVHVKHGLYDYTWFSESELDQIEVGEGR